MLPKAKGLTSLEAKARLARFGLNVLSEKKPLSSPTIFLLQLKNPLVYVLLAACLVSLVLGDYQDAAIIFFVVLVNSVLGFVQEKKANSALVALKALVHPTVEVIRDGVKMRIDVKYLVPGDIVELEQGEKVPADGKLVRANRLFVEEAILTGEAVPVNKDTGDEVYMGTLIASGEAVVEVLQTGSGTEVGKIALSVQKPDEDTPLTKQLKVFSSHLTILVGLLTVFVFLIGLVTGKDLYEIFKTSVALAVSAIPEGLLIALTVVLAIGMQRILKEKGLVRNLVSAETLGGVTTICVDKTGTLTYGKLEVVEEIGNIEDVCVQHFASTDDPIMVAARDWLSEHSVHFKTTETQFNGDCVMIDSIPFIPQNRYYASLIEHKNKQKEIYVNGAPETLMDWSTLTKIERGQVEAKIRSFTKEGKRVIAMAKKAAPTQMTKISEQEINGLKWVGLLVFMDSVRVGVRDSFDQAKKSGIKTIVITGDYAATAVAVMSEIGMEMSKERIILGDDLEKMTVLEVSKRLANLYKAGNKPILFARTLPEQKLKVITALKKNNEVVAMMGDGVNDAPAIHRADIGIVVGDATDVARESADLVLLDSSFKTIIDAIKEGRAIFDNIRKIVLYLLSDSFEEIVTVAGTIVLGVILLEKVPLPVTAAQILWINLVSDGFPHLALTVDPKREDIMNEPPRNPKEILVSGWMRKLIFIVSLSGGIIALVLFMYFYKTTGDIVFSRSIAFAALGVNSLVYVFSVRTLKAPFWKQNPFENKWLNLAVFLGLAFQVVPFFFAGTRAFLLLTPLQPAHWAVVFGSAGAMFVLIEVAKVRLIKD